MHKRGTQNPKLKMTNFPDVFGYCQFGLFYSIIAGWGSPRVCLGFSIEGIKNAENQNLLLMYLKKNMPHSSQTVLKGSFQSPSLYTHKLELNSK